MTNDWTALAREHGRRSVMSLQITDAQLDAETNRQIPLLMGLISGQLHGHERSALDFGCGAGRFTHALAHTVHGRATGFDPCAELVAMARGEIDTDYCSGSPDDFFTECKRNETDFDVVLTAQVLGAPGLNLDSTSKGLVDVLAPGGLLIVTDHMPLILPPDRWWRFRPAALYRDVFARNGVELECIGELGQLTETITVLAGRLP